VAPPWLGPLRQFYHAFGYVRRPQASHAHRQELEHLWEVRFLVSGKRNLELLHRLLARAGLPPGEAKRLCGVQTQIIPGRAVVERLMALMGREGGHENR
jgi:hypothetical protein